MINGKLKVGDLFYFGGTKQRGSTSGKVIKINRVTFDYEGSYFGKPTTHRTRYDDFIGGKFIILRDGVKTTLTEGN